jgi:hypothetical protein
LGDDKLNFKLKNIGESNVIIDNAEIENAYKYLDDLENIENKTSDDLENINLLTECANDHAAAMNFVNNSLTADELANLIEKTSIKKYLNFTLSNIKQSSYNAFGASDFQIFFNINKFKIDINYLNGTPLIFKIFYRKENSPTKYIKYMYNKHSFNLKFVVGKMELLHNAEIEDIKYIRPLSRNTLFIDLYRNIKFDNV